jgi:hypothetical protein
MRYLAAFLILTTSLFAHAQKPVAPTVTHLLHGGKLRQARLTLKMTVVPPKAVIGASADGAVVFVLIPLADGHWELQMIAGWQTSAPIVRSLQFEGDIPVNDLNFILPQLTPSPDGRFLLVRTLTLNFSDYQRSAVVVLIDLHAFQIVWRRVSTDPLIAYSRWHFNRKGELIAAQGPKTWNRSTDKHGIGTEAFSYDVVQVNPASPGEHDAAIFSLPELATSLSCHYRVSKGSNSDNPSPDLVYDDDLSDAPQSVAEVDGADCPILLTAAGVQSAAQLPGASDEQWGMIGIDACEAFALGAGRSVSMIDCRDHHAVGEDGKPTWVRFADINFTSPRAPGFSVRVGSGEDASAAIARADGQEYLLVLRKGLKLEVYKLP